MKILYVDPTLKFSDFNFLKVEYSSFVEHSSFGMAAVPHETWKQIGYRPFSFKPTKLHFKRNNSKQKQIQKKNYTIVVEKDSSASWHSRDILIKPWQVFSLVFWWDSSKLLFGSRISMVKLFTEGILNSKKAHGEEYK